MPFIRGLVALKVEYSIDSVADYFRHALSKQETDNHKNATDACYPMAQNGIYSRAWVV